jgi:hypothetical protein
MTRKRDKFEEIGSSKCGMWDQVARNLLSQHTQGLEVYYNIAVTRSIALTLDFQWADSAFKDVDSATVLAARLNIDF